MVSAVQSSCSSGRRALPLSRSSAKWRRAGGGGCCGTAVAGSRRTLQPRRRPPPPPLPPRSTPPSWRPTRRGARRPSGAAWSSSTSRCTRLPLSRKSCGCTGSGSGPSTWSTRRPSPSTPTAGTGASPRPPSCRGCRPEHIRRSRKHRGPGRGLPRPWSGERRRLGLRHRGLRRPWSRERRHLRPRQRRSPRPKRWQSWAWTCCVTSCAMRSCRRASIRTRSDRSSTVTRTTHPRLFSRSLFPPLPPFYASATRYWLPPLWVRSGVGWWERDAGFLGRAVSSVGLPQVQRIEHCY